MTLIIHRIHSETRGFINCLKNCLISGPFYKTVYSFLLSNSIKVSFNSPTAGHVPNVIEIGNHNKNSVPIYVRVGRYSKNLEFVMIEEYVYNSVTNRPHIPIHK